IGGDELGLSVSVQIFEPVADIAPEVASQLVTATGVAVDVGPEAAMGAARVEVENYLRLSVPVEVADKDRLAVAEAGRIDLGPVQELRDARLQEGYLPP